MRLSKPALIAGAVLVFAAACSGSASTAAPGSTAPPGSTDQGTNPGTPAPVTAPPMPAAGGGWCKVDITGGVTYSWNTQQTMATLQMDAWLDSSARDLLGLTADSGGFLMNCQATAGSVSLLSVDGTKPTDFPQGAGTYVIRPQGKASAAVVPGMVNTLVNLHDQKIWAVSEPGTFTVITLGTNHFVGSFQFKMVSMDDAATTATVTGSFDLGCTSGTCA